jgi:hypothetical protein
MVSPVKCVRLTQTHHYRDHLENAVYSENHVKLINTLCRENAELLPVTEGGTYSCHWALKELIPNYKLKACTHFLETFNLCSTHTLLM